MVGWNHCLNVQEFEQTSGDSEGQGSLGTEPWDCIVEHNLETQQQQQHAEYITQCTLHVNVIHFHY